MYECGCARPNVCLCNARKIERSEVSQQMSREVLQWVCMLRERLHSGGVCNKYIVGEGTVHT